MLKEISLSEIENTLLSIKENVLTGKRITPEEGLLLLEHADVAFLGTMANQIREERHGDTTYFNKNFHIEPTNICVFDCKFCSYSRFLREREEYDAWELSKEDTLKIVNDQKNSGATEVHIVGGVHPKMDLPYFVDIIKEIKKINPDLHIKAFTAVELAYMAKKAKLSYKETLQALKEAGQNSLPGGGAEIFHSEVREEICKDKCTGDEWLAIHEAAHSLGMPSNATMLYGHVEKPSHIIDHLEKLRSLQDKTGGFNTFIPLKFRNGNNQMSHIKEVSRIEDIKIYALSRIYLDNFSHIKAYWPMIGRETAQLLLSFGVNDIDGTIDDSTKIYSMAGAEEQSPSMTSDEIIHLIQDAGRKAVERDSIYNTLNTFN